MTTTIDGYNPKKRTRRRVLFLKCQGSEGQNYDLTIDEDDYLVVRDIALVSKRGNFNPANILLYKMVEVNEDDEERRVSKLTVPGGMLSLPASVGRLKNLTHLDLTSTRITSLPASILTLTALKKLRLQRTRNLSALPEKIGDLTSLNALKLSDSGIALLPFSIGRLCNLKELDLSWTKRLQTLTEEIGNLVSLNKLNLHGSKIESIPPSVGQLQNLKFLYLGCTEKLLELPKEIGALTSLVGLYAFHSSIKSLPCSIGSLTSLRVLSLGNSKVASLPNSIGRLTSLIYLNVCDTQIPELQEQDPTDFLLSLVQNCPSLSWLGHCMEHQLFGLKDIEEGKKKLFHHLVCNRAWYRIWSNAATKPCSIQTTPELWPLMLECAEHALDLPFDELLDLPFDELPALSSCKDTMKQKLNKPDAIYELLVCGREPFLGILINYNSTTKP